MSMTKPRQRVKPKCWYYTSGLFRGFDLPCGLLNAAIYRRGAASDVAKHPLIYNGSLPSQATGVRHYGNGLERANIPRCLTAKQRVDHEAARLCQYACSCLSRLCQSVAAISNY